MQCNNCHNNLVGTELYCPQCGTKVSSGITVDGSKSTESIRSASIILGVISIFCLFVGILSPIAIILSIIGLVLAIKSNKNVKNVPGIIINSVTLFVSIIVTIFFILVIIFSINIVEDHWSEIVPNINIDVNHGDF